MVGAEWASAGAGTGVRWSRGSWQGRSGGRVRTIRTVGLDVGTFLQEELGCGRLLAAYRAEQRSTPLRARRGRHWESHKEVAAAALVGAAELA